LDLLNLVQAYSLGILLLAPITAITLACLFTIASKGEWL
jgi:hypothetical protein